ncbi:MAG: ABC transporter permease [Acidobacteriota bacterium]|nr:ABC transporter permease [Acidobacteriota bacterium]
MHLLLRSALRLAAVLFGISVLVFLIVHAIPGDPAVIAAGLESSPETVERIRHDLGLDQPLPTQFVRFLSHAAAGDLGTSIRTGAPVLREIRERLPHTLILTLGGIVLATLVGLAAGILAAVARRRMLDRLVMAATLVAVSTPSYWLALMGMLVFALQLGWLPSIGVGTPLHYVLPVLALGLQSGGQIARITRAATRDTLHQPYVRAAKARGAGRVRIIVRHALANAMLPVTTLIGLRIGGLLAGTVLVESVFAIPGVGRMMVDAVVARDFPMVQGGVLVVATLIVVVNVTTDLVVATLDPRVRT